ncbi:unnamed protein product [Cylicocyclus nassatus]|uniref:Uncharacterized protein n=1 Tax=Cylicocyclus nassatus TaxID=53992 RepID=A0AA36M8F6_CYLNA|nr:unnamed protein product [Cylicocyclus nassatus]
MDEKKVRITAMTSVEMCIVSQRYVKNYEVYHGISTSSSKDGLSFTQRKQKLLEDICEDLVRNGFSKRTPEQIDQKIKDTLKMAKKISALEQHEETKTGGGPPTATAAPPHVKIVIEGCDNRPRLSGLEKPLEINANATVDLFLSADENTPVTPLTSGWGEKPLNSPPRKRRRSTQALTEEKEQILQLEAGRIQKQIQNEFYAVKYYSNQWKTRGKKMFCSACNVKREAVKMTMAEFVPSLSKGKRPGILVESGAPSKKRGRTKGRNGYLRKKSHTAAVRSCTDLTDRASGRHFASPKSQLMPATSNGDGLSAKRRKDGSRERARSWASTGSADFCSRNKRRRDLSVHSSNTSDDGGCVTPPLRIDEETAAEIANSRESRNASDRSREARLEREADSWIRYLIKKVWS